MIIRELDINSFGKLENCNIELKNGLNVIYGKNESGKSTIAHFIESMLFGFGKSKSDREKCIPWDKDTAFGSMCVERNGDFITVFRKMGKTQKFDAKTFSPEEADFSVFLPKDRETYRKSVYCRENDAAYFGATEEIEQRLVNLLSTGDESINSTRAIEILEKNRKTLRAFRGASGRFYEVEEKLAILKEEHYKALEQSNKNAENLKKIESLKKEYDLEHKNFLALSLENDNGAFLNEINIEIERQKAFIDSFPESSAHYPEKNKFFSKGFLLSIIFTLCVFIIGYFYRTCYLLSPLPIFTYGIYYLCKALKIKKKQKAFLKEVMCADYSEYEKLLQDKSEAIEHLDSLLEIKENAVNTSSEKIELINNSTNRLLALKEEISGLEKAVSASVFRPLDEIISEISYFTEQKEDILIKVEALDSAIRALKRAKDIVSADFTPLINEKAVNYINMIAPKKTRSISIKNDFSLFLTDPLPHDVSEFSHGYKEEVYLCFRLALAEVLFPESFPLILDNPFAASDDERENRLLDLFYTISKTRQVILFTNRKNPRFSQMDCNYVDISPDYDV